MQQSPSQDTRACVFRHPGLRALVGRALCHDVFSLTALYQWTLRVDVFSGGPILALRDRSLLCLASTSLDVFSNVFLDVCSSPFFIPSPLLTHVSAASFTLGKLECIEEVVGLEVKNMQAAQRAPYLNYGTWGDSFNLMTEAWHDLEHELSIHGIHSCASAPAVQGPYHYTGPQHPLHILNHHPVDLLVVECGRWQCPHPPLAGHRWELMIQATSQNSRPSTIIEIWSPNSLLWELGPTGKAAWVQWATMGYVTKMKVIDPQHCGGAIVQPRAIVIRHA